VGLRQANIFSKKFVLFLKTKSFIFALSKKQFLFQKTHFQKFKK